MEVAVNINIDTDRLSLVVPDVPDGILYINDSVE